MAVKKLNYIEIRKSFLNFFAVFCILISFSFLSIYCFFKSAEIQYNNIENDVLEYKEVLNKHYILKRKLDTVYHNMSLINTGKVRNDLFLESYISKDIQEIKLMIGKDREGYFQYYYNLIPKIDSLLLLKNQIISISDKESIALRDLNECMGKFAKVYSELTEDPTRKFNKK